MMERGNYQRHQLPNGSRKMEIVAILLLTITMVGIGWAANDRGEVRTAGGEKTTRPVDA